MTDKELYGFNVDGFFEISDHCDTYKVGLPIGDWHTVDSLNGAVGNYELPYQRIHIVTVGVSLKAAINTLRHEIAHHICWSLWQYLSHGPFWQDVALDIGCAAITSSAHAQALIEADKEMVKIYNPQLRLCNHILLSPTQAREEA